MAFREVTMLEIKEVLRRWLRGETKSEISRQCGVSRGTARSYIRAAEEGGLSPGQGDDVLDDEWLAALAARLHPSSGRPRGEGWWVCERHQEYISKKLEGRVRLTKIRKLLRPHHPADRPHDLQARRAPMSPLTLFGRSPIAARWDPPSSS